MKRPVNLIYLIVSIAVFAVFSILTLSFGINYKWVSYGSFWTVWLLTVVPVFISTAITCIYLCKYKNSEFFISLPLVICSYVFSAITYVLGTVLIIVVSSTKSNVTWYMWAIELIIIVVYAVILFYVIYGTNYIFQNRNNVKRKVNFIRDMVGKLNVVIPSIQDENLKSAVVELRDDIKYSDPMSNGSVSEIEQSIFSTVNDVIEKINTGTDFAGCKIQLQKARMLVAQRNEEIKSGK